MKKIKFEIETNLYTPDGERDKFTVEAYSMREALRSASTQIINCEVEKITNTETRNVVFEQKYL